MVEPERLSGVIDLRALSGITGLGGNLTFAPSYHWRVAFSLPICKIHSEIPASLVLAVRHTVSWLSSPVTFTKTQLVWGESQAVS